MANLTHNIRQVNADFQAIKNEIVASGVEVVEGTKTSEYANKVGEVYEAGKTRGNQEGYDRGHQDGTTEGMVVGRQIEREWFWNAYTNRYTWVTYGVFYGGVWDFDNFYPACDIRPVGDSTRLFYAWEGQMGKNHSGSLKKRFEECGVVLDTSQATNLTNAFSYSYITEIPTVDCTNLGSSTTHVFNATRAPYVDIEKLIVNEQLTYSNWFSKVRNISFEGVIGQNIDFRNSNLLSKASIESIVTHLSDTASGKTLTLSKTAVENAFTDTEWDALESTKTNWTISLV